MGDLGMDEEVVREAGFELDIDGALVGET